MGKQPPGHEGTKKILALLKFMTQHQFHLAQLNIATIRASLSDPQMADFVAQLQTINAIAETSSGFIWRLQDDHQGDATHIQAYDDPRILINLTIWESVETLSNYVYRSQHGTAMRDRRKWFEKSDQPTLVLWWIPVGHIPTIAEAKERLAYLHQYGETPYAFSFKRSFPPTRLAESNEASR